MTVTRSLPVRQFVFAGRHHINARLVSELPVVVLDEVSRVVLVVLDGLRPDAIDEFDLCALQHVMYRGAHTLEGRTVDPSNGICSDWIRLPNKGSGLSSLPDLVRRGGYFRALLHGGCAGHKDGWMSRSYGEAARRMDGAIELILLSQQMPAMV